MCYELSIKHYTSQPILILINLTYQSIKKDNSKETQFSQSMHIFCKNIGNLDLISKKIRYNLVLNKFFAPHNARMCNEHVGVVTTGQLSNTGKK